MLDLLFTLNLLNILFNVSLDLKSNIKFQFQQKLI